METSALVFQAVVTMGSFIGYAAWDNLKALRETKTDTKAASPGIQMSTPYARRSSEQSARTSSRPGVPANQPGRIAEAA